MTELEVDPPVGAYVLLEDPDDDLVEVCQVAVSTDEHLIVKLIDGEERYVDDDMIMVIDRSVEAWPHEWLLKLDKGMLNRSNRRMAQLNRCGTRPLQGLRGSMR
jgi:hypothetical protein